MDSSLADFTVHNTITWTASNGSSDIPSVYQSTSTSEGILTSENSNLELIFNGICIPIVTSAGVFGNILNLTILSWRCNKRAISDLERGALLGLIALAVSDLCFCLGILPNFVFYDAKSFFYSKGFHYYFQIYGSYFHNVFIKVSTWLTVVIATARYIAICHPLKARSFTSLRSTKLTIMATYIIWFVLMTPLLWSYITTSHDIDEHITVYVLDLGYFLTNIRFKLSLTYIWSLLGCFIPVTMLTYCNINLIRELHRAKKWRESSANNASSICRKTNERITTTLVALVLMYLVLVAPSELLHFYLATTHPDTYPSLQVAIWSTNLMQAVNFSFHFLLYCALNVTFRKTIVQVFYAMFRKCQPVSEHTELHYLPS